MTLWSQRGKNASLAILPFGLKAQKEFAEDDHAMILVFIESLTPEQRVPLLRHIVFFTMECQFGLRGREEHRDMMINDISFNVHPMTAGAGLAGKPHVQIGGGMLSKSHQMTVGKLH